MFIGLALTMGRRLMFQSVDSSEMTQVVIIMVLLVAVLTVEFVSAYVNFIRHFCNRLFYYNFIACSANKTFIFCP